MGGPGKRLAASRLQSLTQPVLSAKVVDGHLATVDESINQSMLHL
jgi:hypothetical protein